MEFPIHPHLESKYQHSPRVIMFNDDTYVVTYTNNGGYSGLYIQRYDFKAPFWKPWGPETRAFTRISS